MQYKYNIHTLSGNKKCICTHLKIGKKGSTEPSFFPFAHTKNSIFVDNEYIILSIYLMRSSNICANIQKVVCILKLLLITHLADIPCFSHDQKFKNIFKLFISIVDDCQKDIGVNLHEEIEAL